MDTKLTVAVNKTTSKRTSEGWEARIVYWKGCNIELTAYGNSEAEAKAELYKELIIRLQDQFAADKLSTANEAESGRQVNETDNKDSVPFKLNPIRVMSMKIGAERWEARTRVFNGINDGLIDLVAVADSEDVARYELDKKFSSFATAMTNFIKFMSQAS